MEAARREEILARYQEHAARLASTAAGAHARLIVAMPLTLRPAALVPLSRRETEVLALLADGLGNKEIGTRLTVSIETIKSHVRSILSKLEARSRAHAIGLAFRHGMLT